MRISILIGLLWCVGICWASGAPSVGIPGGIQMPTGLPGLPGDSSPAGGAPSAPPGGNATKKKGSSSSGSSSNSHSNSRSSSEEKSSKGSLIGQNVVPKLPTDAIKPKSAVAQVSDAPPTEQPEGSG